MPWINQDMCTGCRLCIRECPVSAIKLNTDGFPEIDEAECVRCGRCHDVCPRDAVRHDSERIPQEVAENLRWVRRLLEHFHEPQEQSAFIQRIVRFFNMQKKVSEQTLAAITAAKNDPAKGIDAAIHDLSENRIPAARVGLGADRRLGRDRASGDTARS